MLADRLVSVMTPFGRSGHVATPFVKVSAVAVPKFVAVPTTLVTVGLLPLGLAEAPAKVRLCEPV